MVGRKLPPGQYNTPPYDLGVTIPGSIPLDTQTTLEFRAFLQGMANRRAVGALRYGDRPKTAQKYMTRLGRELKAYRATGNAEHLFNVAVYAFLESVAPEHRNQHWDMAVESVTRADMGGNIA